MAKQDREARHASHHASHHNCLNLPPAAFIFPLPSQPQTDLSSVFFHPSLLTLVCDPAVPVDLTSIIPFVSLSTVEMIINPELLTASVATSTVAPIPTITPGNDPLYEKAGDVGNRTLW